jgi:hypothetical protein
MRNKARSSTAAVAIVGILFAGPAQAFNFGNMMNPSRWFGGRNNSDRYYDDYYGDPGYYGGGPGYYGGDPGYYGAPGYYGGTPGYGVAPGYGADPAYGGTPGYGSESGYASPSGYGTTPGYSMDPGYGGTPGYGAPASGSASDKAEIERLKARIRKLEEGDR